MYIGEEYVQLHIKRMVPVLLVQQILENIKLELHTEEAGAVKSIKWKCVSPTAAWWGGWWISLMRLIRHIFKRILGQA